MKISQINKLIEEYGSRWKLKFLHGKLLKVQSKVADSRDAKTHQFKCGWLLPQNRTFIFQTAILLFSTSQFQRVKALWVESKGSRLKPC